MVRIQHLCKLVVVFLVNVALVSIVVEHLKNVTVDLWLLNLPVLPRLSVPISFLYLSVPFSSYSLPTDGSVWLTWLQL